ncbi:YicC/YloC family endoribonuclease [Phaeocystidibacter luteus]|uniref:YicC family protein n=1 Tax=Phaeocystidibacter luteus TaxID=911197 RepID=A0A6N6REN0_9FLAO|nr:YicC/YloC family endoribonuclease [Phaeocystidibacter luteus]KAB2808626.1 YicC family protein [Phaeocystidibacter luteus]
MIRSMTGFGKAVAQLPGKKVTVEIKSLNSKGLDLNLRLPGSHREMEVDVRDLLANGIQRGKADIGFYVELTGADEAPAINAEVVKGYVRQLNGIARELGLESDVLSLAMRMPDALKNESREVSDEEKKAILDTFSEALEKFNTFRSREGDHLEEDLRGNIQTIRDLLAAVPQFEEERIVNTRERMLKALENLEAKVDENRFEQELVFYLEKYDVNEEKVRLAGHLDHFVESLAESGVHGRKLGFISQEIGREINTLGSKANHVEMQKLVVGMKEELEKIKEQVLNVL